MSLEEIQRHSILVDVHAHPSRFHRANVERIGSDELDRYRRHHIDLVVCAISTDAVFGGDYVERDGTAVPAGPRRPATGDAFRFTTDRFARIRATAEMDGVVVVSTPGEVERAKAEANLALLPAIEGGDGLEGSLERLRDLHGAGLGIVQLVHFRANEIGHIQTHPYAPGGLTPFGRSVVRECNRLGLMVDLAHANTETLLDTLEVSTQPVLCSHTGARALHDADRLLSDLDIRAIATRGGLIGIWPYGVCIPTIDRFADHVDHVVQLTGIEHVAIGTDLRGIPSYTSGFGPDANFGAIAEALGGRGYTDESVAMVMGGSFVRLWRMVRSETDRAPA